MRLIRIIIFIFLFSFSILYGFIILIRNKLFDFNILKSVSFDIPVISVGNITVGGTGKTPHIEYLISLLKDEYGLATLSRGYKRKTRNFELATETSTVEEVGDEPLQIKQKFSNINVAVDRKRVQGIQKLIAQVENLDVVLLDDAYQHRYVNPGYSILLMDYNRPIYRDFVLPGGRLREFPYGKRRADIIVVSKCPADMSRDEQNFMATKLELKPYQHIFFSSVSYSNLRSVFGKEELDFAKIENKSVILLSGIANPVPLKKYLEHHVKNLFLLTFSDHHTFSVNDIKKVNEIFNEVEDENKIILTTEKDAVRLRSISQLDERIKSVLYYLPISVSFLGDNSLEFNRQVLEYVKKNRRNS